MKKDRVSLGTFICTAAVALLLANLAVAQEIATGPDSSVDGYLMIVPDEYGSWSSTTWAGDGDLFNPTGAYVAEEAAFTSGFFLFVGDVQRELLSENGNWQEMFVDPSLDTEIAAANVPSDTDGDGVDDTLVGSFLVFGGATDLAFDVTQHVGSLGESVAVLQQDYTITNNGNSSISFVMVRAFDGDLLWEGDFDGDEVGTSTWGAGLGPYVFEQEALAPGDTAVTLSGQAGGDYYASKLGITPDEGEPPYGYGTDFQVWDAYGIPATWANFVPDVGYGMNGVSGDFPPGCGSPCDGAIGLDFAIDLEPGDTTTITVYHTYGANTPLGGGGMPLGACCLGDGTCDMVDEMACEAMGGTFQGDGVQCDPNPCQQAPISPYEPPMAEVPAAQPKDLAGHAHPSPEPLPNPSIPSNFFAPESGGSEDLSGPDDWDPRKNGGLLIQPGMGWSGWWVLGESWLPPLYAPQPLPGSPWPRLPDPPLPFPDFEDEDELGDEDIKVPVPDLPEPETDDTPPPPPPFRPPPEELPPTPRPPPPGGVVLPPRPPGNLGPGPLTRNTAKAYRKLRDKIEKLEGQIERAEKTVAETERKLADARKARDWEKVKSLEDDLDVYQGHVWDLEKKLEKLKKKLNEFEELHTDERLERLLERLDEWLEQNPGADENSDPVYLFSGEYRLDSVDLWIEGRGFDFIWKRSYRSKFGKYTVQGNNWDFSYNLSVRRAGADLFLADGNTRDDIYLEQPDGTYVAWGFFRVLEENPDGTFTLTFRNRARWDFLPLDGSAGEGKIAEITDRNGNAMTFAYDPAGRLVTVTDTLGRDIDIAYNPDGFIESVTDFTGRQVSYEYYADGDADGSAGDLKSVRTPIVVGTPTGNDFPDGKLVTYTYSTGFFDDRLNHNLLTLTNPRQNDPDDPQFGAGPVLVNVYHPTTDASDFNFDRVIRQEYGGGIYDFVYLAVVPDPSNNFAVVKAIINDRAGNVEELFYDALNRLVVRKEFTGRAPDPTAPTTDFDNRPINPLRPTDPPVFVTKWQHDSESNVHVVELPNGGTIFFNHDMANVNQRSRGNLLTALQLPGPLGGDQGLILQSLSYDPDFNFVTTHRDGRGNTVTFTYDGSGNLVQVTDRIPSIACDYDYNAFGQLIQRTLPANDSGHRRIDSFDYYDSGPQTGYLGEAVIDAGALALTAAFEYDDRGNVLRVVDPRGADALLEWNTLDQLVRYTSREVEAGSGPRYEVDWFYDANDNVRRIDARNIDADGALQPNAEFTHTYEYDLLDRLVRQTDEVDESHTIATEFDYDANDNVAEVRFGEATNGNEPTNTVSYLYDERDLLFQEIRAPASAIQSTTQTDYDGNQNVAAVRQGLEDTPHVWEYQCDGYDRMTTATDPMGNVATYTYDAGGNRVAERLDGELVDVPGNGANGRLREVTYVYDEMNRLTRRDRAFFDPATQTPILDGLATTRFEYSDTSQLTRRWNDNDHATMYAYDGANRVALVTDAKNNTLAYAYDENSNVTALVETAGSDLGAPDQVFTTSYMYDGLDRLTAFFDNVGNTTDYAYDSRSNRTRTVDALANVTQYEYDGVNRLVQVVRFLTDDGTGGGAPVGSIMLTWSWDDSSRLTSRTDDNGHTTLYEYDALNQLVSLRHADDTVHTRQYGVHHNPVLLIDANGSETAYTYDGLDRLTSRNIIPGPGVSSDTTFVNYTYDGLSRVVTAVDDDSTVTRAYDSLSNVTGETLNGASITHTHDGVGNTLGSTYPGGRAIHYEYDALERTVNINEGDPALPIATFAYVGPDRVERCTYGNDTRTDYTYDGATGVPNPPGDFGVKRVIRTRHAKIGDGSVLDERTYAWDAKYNKTQRSDVRSGGPGFTYDYAYDSVYRLLSTTVTDESGTVVRETSYTLDGLGNRLFVVGGPDAGSYTRDPTLPEPADAQVNQYTTTPSERRQYDLNGNLTAAQDCRGSGDANCDGDIDVADIDAFILALTQGQAAWEAEYGGPGCGFLAAVDINCDYLANGRDIGSFVAVLTGRPADPQFQVVYDYRDRMVEYLDATAGQYHRYAYDALGRRIQKTIDAGGSPAVTRYFYDRARVCEERDGVGLTEATYVFGPSQQEVLAMQRGGVDRYYHCDDRRNVVALTDGTGNVLERYDYADFGRPLDPDTLTPLDDSGVGNPYFFTGRRFDPETRWHHLARRYLDHSTGRFTTRHASGM